MPRRGENIYKRKDGRYEGRYIKGHNADGKTKFGYVYANKLSVCKEKLNKAKTMQMGRSSTLKIGEICALKWEDIDLNNGIMRISNTIKRIKCDNFNMKTCIVEGSAKSLLSKRTMPLPPCIAELLQEHKESTSNEYVFTYKGHVLEPRVLQYRFKALLKKAGLEDVNFHALRHTFAKMSGAKHRCKDSERNFGAQLCKIHLRHVRTQPDGAKAKSNGMPK